MWIENFNLSRHNDDCLKAIDKSMAGEYHLVTGLSSYEVDREFLFKGELKPLMIKIQECINEYIRPHEELIKKKILEPVVISSSWFNILGKGQRVERHRHVESWSDRNGSVVSGAYYPYVDPNSAPLIFTFPQGKTITMPCASGSLVIFPSWVDHHTIENKTDKRITVSFNTVRKSVVLEKFPNSVKEAEERLRENNDSS
tara:strand:+ start:324 stop:923 length:600 start_codon:yes stop_codon:yes gene_type:complete